MDSTRSLGKSNGIPGLPLEIWMSITRFATWVPDSLEPQAGLDISPSFALDQRELYRKSMATKQSLALVCKSWHSMTLPYLYEHIRISHGKTLQKVYILLQQSRLKSSAASPSLGWSTKRLDLAMRDSLANECDRRPEFGIICNMVEHLPNLAILLFGVTAPKYQNVSIPLCFFRRILASCGPTLKFLGWQNTNLTPEDDWYSVLAEECPVLEVLCCPDRTRSQLTSELTFPSLQMLFVRPHDSITESNIPALRRVLIEVYRFIDPPPLFQNHGANLEVVQLDLSHSCFQFTALLKMLTAQCPNLSRLDFSLPKWSVMDRPDFVLPPTVRIFGVQRMAINDSTEGYTTLYSALERMEFSSKLEAIQFLDAWNLRDLRRKHWRVFNDIVQMMNGKGVKVLDPKGMVVS